MRHIILLAAVFIAAFAVPPAHAGWSVKEHSTRDSLTWSASNGHKLEFESTSGKGIEVAVLEPATTYGLQQGDVVVSMNGHAVDHVADLLQAWSVNKGNPAKITVVRRGGVQHLTMPAADFNALIHPHP